MKPFKLSQKIWYLFLLFLSLSLSGLEQLIKKIINTPYIYVRNYIFVTVSHITAMSLLVLLFSFFHQKLKDQAVMFSDI